MAHLARSHPYASMDAMRVQTLIALCSVVVATTACGKHELMAPNGTGNKAEIPANVQQMIPEDAFPLAKRFAKDCEIQKDLASCHYLGWMLSEGMAVPIEHADETDDSVVDSYHVREPIYSAVPKNTDNANALFRAACDGGWASACVSLTKAGAAENSAALLSSGCQQGEAGACETLVELAAAGGLVGISAEDIEAQLEATCNAGRLDACILQAATSERFGQPTAAAVENPTLLDIKRRSRGTTVVVYTDNAAEGRAVAVRAREAFGNDTNIEVRPAQGAVSSDWLQSVPELLALAKGVPASAHVELKRNNLTLTTVITDAAQAGAVREALARIGGESREVVAHLDPPPAPVEGAEVEAN